MQLGALIICPSMQFPFAFLQWWKGYTVKEDTWKLRENLKNTENLVREFEKEYKEEIGLSQMATY